MTATNTIPARWDTIAMPRLTAGLLKPDRWHRVDHSATTPERNAAVLASEMCAREVGGGAFLGHRDDLARSYSWAPRRILFALCASPAHGCVDGFGEAAPLWVLCRQDPGELAEIGRVWVHPHSRGHGHLKQLWPALLDALGTPTPAIDAPYSPAMRALLRAVRQPSWDGSGVLLVDQAA